MLAMGPDRDLIQPTLTGFNVAPSPITAWENEGGRLACPYPDTSLSLSSHGLDLSVTPEGVQFVTDFSELDGGHVQSHELFGY